MTTAEAFELLNLPRTAPLSAVQSRWQCLRSKYHPDKGGHADTFHTLGLAYKVARVNIAKCRACNGTGKVQQSYGITALFVDCKECRK